MNAVVSALRHVPKPGYGLAPRSHTFSSSAGSYTHIPVSPSVRVCVCLHLFIFFLCTFFCLKSRTVMILKLYQIACWVLFFFKWHSFFYYIMFCMLLLKYISLANLVMVHNSQGDYSFSGMGIKTHSTDFSSGKSDSKYQPQTISLFFFIYFLHFLLFN